MRKLLLVFAFALSCFANGGNGNGDLNLGAPPQCGSNCPWGN